MNDATRLRDSELGWFRKLIDKQGELSSYERGMGQAVIDSGDLSSVAACDRLSSECAAISSAIAAIRKQRPAAIIDAFRAQAAELRKQAKSKLAEREKLIRETEKHLRALSQIEGVEFSRGILAAQRSGAWSNLTNGRFDIDDLDPAQAVHACGTLQPSFQVPKSGKLLVEVHRLEDQAHALENSAPTIAGWVEGDSLESLITEIFSDPLRIGPPAVSVAEWVRAEELKFAKENPGAVVVTRRFRVSWNAGELDTANSAAYFTSSRAIAA